MALTYYQLTPAEQKVLDHLVEGETNAAIAVAVGCSEFTVKHHIRSIIEKLRAVNRVHAAALAVEMKLAHPQKQVVEGYAHVKTRERPKYAERVEVSGEARRKERVRGWSELTKREREICLFLASDEAAGLVNEAVADRLSISVNTFCTHRRSIYKKLDVQDRETLVRKIVRVGGDPERRAYVVIN